ncbi:MAG: helix-turn-helix transcriptional regulator [Chloroflexi bacterium]|nr:MAG: helix-turn-helix transcriptional regulator [Chloroflexota bacterium]
MTVSAVAQRTMRELERLSRSGLDSRTFRRAALKQIERVVPVDAAFFAAADPTTLLHTDAVVDDILRPHAAEFLRIEFLADDVNQFRDLARADRIVSTLDIETVGRRQRSPRYTEILEPLGLGDELRIALIEGGNCWGFMCLHRGRGAGFAASEVSFMRRTAYHLATGLRTGLLLESVSRGPDPDEPGLLVLSGDLSLVSANAAAERLLAELGDEHWRGQAELPAAVYGVVGGLLARERDELPAGPQPRTGMRMATGRWLTLHATWLAGPRPESERQIGLVLETASPTQIWPLVTAAHQLSPRESEVTLLVARGFSTSEISQALRISDNTVQGYLKAVFDKFGVRSRGQLVAAIFGSHYLPLMQRSSS